MKATITVEIPDGGPDGSPRVWEWVRNEDGTWMGPLVGEDSMTDQEVWEQIEAVVAGDLS